MTKEDTLRAFIKDKSALFWWIPEDDRENISIGILVETILNFGKADDVKRLFDLLGIEKVAEVFQKQVNGKRPNYFPRTIHYFKLYFRKYAPRNSD